MSAWMGCAQTGRRRWRRQRRRLPAPPPVPPEEGGRERGLASRGECGGQIQPCCHFRDETLDEPEKLVSESSTPRQGWSKVGCLQWAHGKDPCEPVRRGCRRGGLWCVLRPAPASRAQRPDSERGCFDHVRELD